jgi:hypothetical protein
MSAPSGRPGADLLEHAAARAMPAGGALMSAPRSKRDDASVLSPSRLLVRRTDAGWKYALSSAIRVVRGADLGVLSAHDAADRQRPRLVGDHEHVAVERALDAVQRPEPFTGRAPGG